MKGISVIIITYNEAKKIGATLDAAWKVADEIIVADSGSTDCTPEICLAKGVRFITMAWQGFGQQRNAAMALALHHHILALDADEVLDEQLIKSILEVKQQGFPQNIYSVQRKNFYYGKFILHGMEKGDIKPRLHHRDVAKWNHKAVHENLEWSAGIKPFVLKGYLLHYSYNNIAEHIDKTDKYTTLAANDYYLAGKAEPGIIKLVAGPAFTFIKAYVINAGFLDGWHGWILAKMHANAVLQKYAKIKMIYFEKRNGPK